MDAPHLSRLLERAAAARPDHVAVEDEHGRAWTFAALDRATDRLHTRLARWGIGREDRVGLFLPKSLEGVAAIHGILRGRGLCAGGSQRAGPPRRRHPGRCPCARCHCLDGAGPRLVRRVARPGTRPTVDRRRPRRLGPSDASWDEVQADTSPTPLPPPSRGDDLAYILYTSGSTGKPKGVMLSHTNAFCFIDWCARAFPTGPDDRFASHAPFHFDLSVFDLYASCRAGATLVLIGETLGKDPARLGAFLRERRLSVWYSAPSILALLAQYGGLERDPVAMILPRQRRSSCRSDNPVRQAGGVGQDCPTYFLAGIIPGSPSEEVGCHGFRSGNPCLPAPDTGSQSGTRGTHRYAPRLVLFAGEVFPIRHLKRLRALWPDAILWNLYGPTETNVCTACAIPATIPADRAEPYPIGPVCPPLEARVVAEDGANVPAGQLGELVIAGPGVMRGYFGRPDLTAAAFLRDASGTAAWYRTGDLVTDDGHGCYTYHGRRDRMVKKRGFRIELGEIEAALHRHDDIHRAAVLAKTDESGVAITAFIAMKPERKGSIIAMKRHCTAHLPHYMIPDTIAFLPHLPMTSTDKVDYQGLKRLVEEA